MTARCSCPRDATVPTPLCPEHGLSAEQIDRIARIVWVAMANARRKPGERQPQWLEEQEYFRQQARQRVRDTLAGEARWDVIPVGLPSLIEGIAWALLDQREEAG